MAKELVKETVSNTVIWDGFKSPPPTALKQIGAGRLKGKTDINPQWRYYAMTQTFGVCGFGWKFTIDKVWTEPASAGQVFAFAKVLLYVKQNGVWSDAIEGIGGSMQITQETNSVHSSDECYKMAITDALSVAMKMLGVASDIYMGLWDGAKYKDANVVVDVKPFTPTKPAETPKAKPIETPKQAEKQAEKPSETSFEGYKAEINSSLNLPHLKAIWTAVTASHSKKEISDAEYKALTIIKDVRKESVK